MKKLLVLLIAFAMCVSFTACGNKPEDSQHDNQSETMEQEDVQQQEDAQGSQETVVTNDRISTELLKSGEVSDIITAIRADNIGDFSTMVFDRNTFAEVLNAAAVDEISAEDAKNAGAPENLSEELPNDTPWWTSLSIVIGDDEVGSITLFENDKTDITTVVAGTRESSKTSYYRNQRLYDLVRRADESELVVDDEFEMYGAKAKESVEAVFEGSKEELGLTDIKLVRFEKVWEDKDDEGNDLALYEYEFSVGVDDPEMFMLAGGMRFDYEMRVRSFNGFYGQLAVKTKGDQLLNSSLLVNDEMVYIGDSAEELRFIKDKIVSVLG